MKSEMFQNRFKLNFSGSYNRRVSTNWRREKNYYKGKIIAATHRDLSESMESGKMREDFFYRLCGDQIQTVSSREILDDSPGEMDLFISFICEKLFGKKGGMEISTGISRILNKSLPKIIYGWVIFGN